MSAAPFFGSRDPREVYARPRQRVVADVWPESVPAVVSRPRAKAKPKAVSSSTVATLKWMGVAGFTACVCFGASALLGKSSVELERRSFATSTVRARAARVDVTRLKLAYDRLTTAASFESWAQDQGYVARHDKPVTPSTTTEVPESAVAMVGDGPQAD